MEMDVRADDPALTDRELTSLLISVYVGGGFTEEAVAPTLFAAGPVRARGTILTAREDGVLAGIVILAAPGSSELRVARKGEAEIHLLAVRPESRGRGIGRALIAGVLALARRRGYSDVVLSTQESMAAANVVYVNAGFQRVPERDWARGKRQFIVYTLKQVTDDEPTV